ncbi:uncharacterized protein J8A68_005817 [[Candida] subhashii]|uniref:Bud site selection protein RAX2 n=1 Tax=[Candida] subhashii TaxID=561895 RepID=A0A8J5QLG2_9ASCO|nr:uncharacterized protein J8A68_005817 [[Candida] subhashii]KAG7660700.1 hypothetical protein J8A68_005817 [[Candida] subhashii]
MLSSYKYLLLISLQLISAVVAEDFFQQVPHPQLNYESLGDRIGLFGSFNALSFYSFVNASSFIQQQQQNTTTRNSKRDDEEPSNGLYVQDITSNNSKRFADLNGDIYQLDSLSDETIVINGNFTTFNNQSVVPPIIYNITSNSITPIFKDKPTGSVKTLYVDNNLIYLGGDFEYNNNTGAAIYDHSKNGLYLTPFQGFGDGAVVNSIAKIGGDGKSDQGSIIFGGKFDTLGLSDLLVHNITGNANSTTNQTDTSIITAEQMISLRQGHFTSVNGAAGNNDGSLICPALNPVWSALPDSGAEWTVQLPSEMINTSPTKVRIYIPDSTDGTSLFRLYTLPNDGIMNLTYIDPATNEMKFCDASCPLSSFTNLKSAVESNIKNADNLNEDDVYVDENDGTYFKYYEPTTKTKTLGYGSNFQEFALVNEVGIDSARITIIDWYGNQALLGGVQFYSNSITVFGDNVLNEPNCDGEFNAETTNYATINSGDFKSIRDISPGNAAIQRNYLVAQDTSAKLTLYPNITYSGDYSLLFYTPGCTFDNSCAQRSVVNVSVIDNENKILSSTMISQNNNEDKFDYLFDGHIEGSDVGNGKARIEISFNSEITPGTAAPWVVVEKAVANIISLDNYSESNSTSSSRRRNNNGLEYIEINGLFEYSLGNFTNFDESLVHYKSGNNDIISLNNTFVGNSSINVLSGQLSTDTTIEQVTFQDDSLLILGDLKSGSENLTLTNSNLVRLTVDSYGDNQTKIDLPTRLRKRDDQIILGGTFNNSISRLVDINDGVLAIGQFSLQSDSMENLATGTSINQSNNFAIYSKDKWYGFGNEYVNADFTNFANVTLNKIEYYVFSTSDGSVFKTWDNTNSEWVEDTNQQLSLTQAIKISETQQILGGSSFESMNFYNIDQAYISNATFNAFGIDIPVKNDDFSISCSFYVNESMSVVGGRFETENETTTNIGFISNTSPNNTIVPLNGDINWGNTTIQALYVDSNYDYLFIGVSGQVELTSSNVTGLVVYDLKNNTFASFQPAALSTSNNDQIEINSLVFYDKGNSLLVGGRFDQAGSLPCPSLCIYDITNTRWLAPQAQVEQTPVDVNGTVTDMRFYQSDQVLIGGNSLSMNNTEYDFITYNFDTGAFNTKDTLNSLGKPIDSFVISDISNSNLNGRMVAYGSDFVSGFDGSEWKRIDDAIDYSKVTQFNDLKLLPVSTARSNNDTYFDKNQILALAGTFTLKNYGLVNMALYNGTTWIPYVFTATNDNFIGDIKSILIDDNYRFQSSKDLTSLDNFLSRGKVVGISLACAVGATAALGLLFVIPYFAFFRRKNNRDYSVASKRIQEQEMMQTIKPEDLLHEIDLQRHH